MRSKILFTVWILSLVVAIPAHAQGVPYIIRSTRPIAAELRAALNDWLAVSPPSDAPYYIVTYTEARGEITLVSMAGVNLSSPDANWSLEDANVTAWLGTVTVQADGSVALITQPPHGGGMMFSPRLSAGGGSYVAFPFAQGTVALYGPRGVHGSGDYGTSGMVAIDLVGGDGMGATAMPPYVYASDAGAIDYVCDDGTSVGVRTHNTSTGDYFVYAHMLDNSNLVMDHAFSAGELIGSLKYGSFNDTCGWAEQHSTHYHVHWMFQPAGGKFQVGSCILTISTQTWQCGDEVVKVGGNLTGGGGFSATGETSGASGAGTVVNDPTFWDYILTGVLAIVDNGILKLLPEHKPFEYTYMLFNIIEIVFRLAWVLVESNINLRPLVTVMVVGIGIRFLFGVIWIVAFLFKSWKSLVPVLGA